MRTYAGLPEIPPEWVARHRGDVHVLDVRSPAEFDGELGHLERSLARSCRSAAISSPAAMQA